MHLEMPSREFSQVQKQLVTSNSKFNNFAVPEGIAPYVQGLVKQSDDITNNFISVADTNNQLTINALNVLRENVKNFSRTVEAAAGYNSNLAKTWHLRTQHFSHNNLP